MIKEYTHEGINQEVTFIAGYYLPEDEKKISYQGKELLYIIGFAEINNSCCGVGGCRYALVPGYVVDWKSKENESGIPVSTVQTIVDEKSKNEIYEQLKKKEMINQIQFW